MGLELAVTSLHHRGHRCPVSSQASFGGLKVKMKNVVVFPVPFVWSRKMKPNAEILMHIVSFSCHGRKGGDNLLVGKVECILFIFSLVKFSLRVYLQLGSMPAGIYVFFIALMKLGGKIHPMKCDF